MAARTPNGSAVPSTGTATPVTEELVLTAHAATFKWTKPTKGYARDQALDDLPALRYALATFLESKMLESEQFINECDPKKSARYCYHILVDP
jgi:hypothetical protein